jgi:hypothetical protein
MPTELIRARARSGGPRSNARNGNIVAVALTAALVMLQLVGLAMLERSHAQPVPPSLVKSSQTSCAESAEVSTTQTPYD